MFDVMTYEPKYHTHANLRWHYVNTLKQLSYNNHKIRYPINELILVVRNMRISNYIIHE